MDVGGPVAIERDVSTRPPAMPPAILRWALDCSSDALAILDADLRYMAVNAAWLAKYRMGQEVLGKSVDELFRSRDASDVMRACLEGSDYHALVRDFTGCLGKLSIQSWRTEGGELGGLTTRHSPVSQSTLSQASDQSGRRLRLAMDMAKVTAFEFDFRSGETVLDPGGAAPRVPPVRGFDDVLKMAPPLYHEAFKKAWAEHLLTGELLILEYEFPRPDGEVRWHMNACEAIKDVEGQVVGMLGMRQDITDRKRAELALFGEREAAQAAARSKSEFLANMSHEIRTPLNGVIAVASVLANTSLDRHQRELVRTIETSGRTLATLLSDVLDCSKIEAGKFELERVAFDPVEVVRHVEALFLPLAEAKGLSFAVELNSEPMGFVVGDSVRLGQILSNLASNAIKFTQRGGVTIEACARTEGVDRRLTFDVKDTGIGLTETARERLFQRFVQADGSITRSFGGTGLGLAISRSLALLMDGDILVQSTPGVGSTFTVEVKLPAVARDKAAAERQASFPCDQLSPIDPRSRVLLVEDHPVNRRIIELMLGGLVTLQTAVNGAEGLAAVQGQGFDVILMDMQMPVMDGLEATRAIRNLERRTGRPRTPIVILSANALAEHVALCVTAGADHHLAKPITLASLLSLVTQILGPEQQDQRAGEAHARG